MSRPSLDRLRSNLQTQFSAMTPGMAGTTRGPSVDPSSHRLDGKIRARISPAFHISQPILRELVQLPEQRNSCPPPWPPAPARAPVLQGIASREVFLREGRSDACQNHRGACTCLGKSGSIPWIRLELPLPSCSPIPMLPVSLILLCNLDASNYEHQSRM